MNPPYKLQKLLLKDQIIDEKDQGSITIRVSERDLDSTDVFAVYTIRKRIAPENEFINSVYDSLKIYEEDKNLKLRIVQIRGTKNMNLFVDATFERVIGKAFTFKNI
ncbi:MAG: hypothetical protein QM535_13860 [Limnohabitans sp.]|nr:hypothetical protein [Limnohabitans sp.]